MNRSGVSAAAVYDSVIERNPRKTRYSSVAVDNCFLVRRLDRPWPITICRQPGQPGGEGAISIQLRLDGYCLAPIRWFRDRGIDPVAMRDESREYRETYWSVARRRLRAFRHPREIWWGLRHPRRPRPVRVEAV